MVTGGIVARVQLKLHCSLLAWTLNCYNGTYDIDCGLTDDIIVVCLIMVGLLGVIRMEEVNWDYSNGTGDIAGSTSGPILARR